MKDVPLGGSTTCMRESLEPCINNSNVLIVECVSVVVNVMLSLMTMDHGRSVLVAIPVRLEDNIKRFFLYGADCYIGEH